MEPKNTAKLTADDIMDVIVTEIDSDDNSTYTEIELIMNDYLHEIFINRTNCLKENNYNSFTDLLENTDDYTSCYIKVYANQNITAQLALNNGDNNPVYDIPLSDTEKNILLEIINSNIPKCYDKT